MPQLAKGHTMHKSNKKGVRLERLGGGGGEAATAISYQLLPSIQALHSVDNKLANSTSEPNLQHKEKSKKERLEKNIQQSISGEAA